MKNQKYNPEIHHRRSIRLNGYDYSQPGFYFITLCTKNREHLFGEIINNELILNDAGLNAVRFWKEIPKHFSNTKLHEFIIMPNHVHGIIEIVGAKHLSPKNDRAKNVLPKNDRAKNVLPLRLCSQTIGSIVRGYKIGFTKWIHINQPIKYPLGSSPWQRNYWEHIIKTEIEYTKISQYIINNPLCWDNDKLNGGDGNTVLEDEIDYNLELWMV